MSFETIESIFMDIILLFVSSKSVKDYNIKKIPPAVFDKNQMTAGRLYTDVILLI